MTGVFVADPGVLYYRGEYYLYPTAGLEPVGVFHSEDLVTWDFAGNVLRHRTNGTWDARDIWAPEVIYDNGVFYMYYTGTEDGSDATRRVGYATATSPTGPFTSGGPLLPAFTIDPHPYRDPATGRRFLYFNGPMPQNNVQELSDFRTLTGSSAVVTHTTLPSEQVWNEAPWVEERDGTYYVFYSAGCFCDESYGLNYATASAPFGVPWTKASENPILSSTATVEGPGHNSIVHGPGGVEQWAVYHGRDTKPGTDVDQRSTRVDRLFWNYDRPFLQPPTVTERVSPDPGTFRDLFNRADGVGLGDAWRLDRPIAWSTTSGAAICPDQVAVNAAIPDADPAVGYVFDVWLKRGEYDVSTGRVGVAAWRSGADTVYAWLDTADNTLVVEGTVAGQPIETTSTPLPQGTDHFAYHELCVTKNESLFSFELDGVRIASRTIAGAAGAGLPGLATDSRPAEFDGAVYSIWSEDRFDRLATTWGDAPGRPKTGAWSVADETLRQTATGPSLSETFKGEASERFEVSVDARLLGEGDSPTPRYGVVARAANGDFVRAGIDTRASRLYVEGMVGGTALVEAAPVLADSFEADDFHNIRVVRDGERFEFLVDNLPVASRAVAIGPTSAGLFTNDVQAEFDNAAVRRLNAPRNLILNPSFEAVQPDSGPAGTNPWQATAGGSSSTGGASFYLDHGGRAKDGALTQHVTGIEPGADYVLTAWVRADRKSSAVLSVEGAATPASVRAKKRRWVEVTVPFRAGTSSSVDVTIRAERGTTSIDEVFLRREISPTSSKGARQIR